MSTIREQQFILQISIPTLVQSTLIASPDLQRAAYVSRYRDGMCVVVDGVEGEKFEGIGEAITFSADSKHIAYVAGSKDRQFIVYDGTPQACCDLTLEGPPALSANGEHLAYGAKKGDRWRVVWDGEELEDHEALGGLSISPDGTRLAYAAIGPGGVSVVVDGTAGRNYDGVVQESLVFRPDGQEVAYGAGDKGGQLVVRNTTEGKRYLGVFGKPIYSRDSRHLMYAANDGDRQFMVLDGAERRRFDYIVVGANETFSADGRHIAYVVKQGAYQYVVADDVPGSPFDGIRAQSVCLNADGKRHAYVGRRGRELFVLCGQQAKGPHSNVWGLVFNATGDHLAYAAAIGRGHTVFVDNEAIFECDGVLSTAAGAVLYFSSERCVRFVALMGGALHSVEVEF